MPTLKQNLHFDEWCKIKKYIHEKRGIVYARKKEIWWCALEYNIGFEQNGKNKYYERPVLILKRFNQNLVLIVALSSISKKTNPYYYHYKLKGRDYSVILSQVKVISTKRLLRKQDIFPKNDFKKVVDKIKNFY